MGTQFIDPKGRTAAVVSLCEAMRQARDYSALPILADTLQDADCTDEVLLSFMRGGVFTEVGAERLVAEVYRDASAAAVKWIEDFAVNALGDSYGYEDLEYAADGSPIPPGPLVEARQPMNYAVLVAGATDFLMTGDRIHQSGSDTWQSAMYGTDAALFWENYERATGRVVPGDKNTSRFFSCSC